MPIILDDGVIVEITEISQAEYRAGIMEIQEPMLLKHSHALVLAEAIIALGEAVAQEVVNSFTSEHGEIRCQEDFGEFLDFLFYQKELLE